MCGRAVVQDTSWREYCEFLRLASFPAIQDSYNFAPTQTVPVIVSRDGTLQAITMRWGMIPSWAKGEAPSYSTINATVEKIETAATWRSPWKRGQRCIMVVSGFYEWHVNEDGKKQPFFIHSAGGEAFGFASIWDSSTNAAGITIESFAIITLPANPLMADIHNSKARMPAILRRDDVETWLRGSVADAMKVLQQFPSDEMDAYRVSTKVNSPKNNGPELIKAIDAA